MKISNETKIGVLTAVAIALLVLGFNFLKGKNLFRSGNFLYAKYTDTKKLMSSNPVYVNGYQVGNVYEIEAASENLSSILVTIKLNKNYEIPSNSVAEIESSPLGTPSITITAGTSSEYLKKDDTIMTRAASGFFGDISTKLAPVADQLTATLSSLDSVLRNFNTVLNPNTKNNFQSVIGNLNRATASLIVSSNSLQQMLDQQSGSLAHTLNNVDSFTKNLSENNGKIDTVLTNLQTTTGNLANLNIDSVVNNLNGSVQKLNAVMDQVNSKNGTLGALINDNQLYSQLQNTVSSANLLMDDLRAHPKRYLDISVITLFGKKDKANYLTSPLNDTTSLK